MPGAQTRPTDESDAILKAMELCRSQRRGWSLEQHLYIDADFYRVERDHWLRPQWFAVAHVSEIPDSGCYIVRDILGESVIIVRRPDGGVSGFFNVCTHRGSRLCREDGRAKRLACPYHAWVFELDGSFANARAMPQAIDTSTLALHPIQLRLVNGVVLGSLAGDPADLDAAVRDLMPALAHHGLAEAQVIERRSYRNYANWKLVLENFMECYHCLPSHPEYSAINGHVALGAGLAATKRWEAEVAEWTERHRAKGGFEITVTGLGVPLSRRHGAHRRPIGRGHRSHTKGGIPVGPLMGLAKEFEGASTGMQFGPFACTICLNDYVMIFHFNPRGAEETDVVITWLVSETAKREDIDIDALVWLWDVTTLQDKLIVEGNAVGVRSMCYRPGPYTELEPNTNDFTASYLEDMEAVLSRSRDRRGFG